MVAVALSQHVCGSSSSSSGAECEKKKKNFFESQKHYFAHSLIGRETFSCREQQEKLLATGDFYMKIKISSKRIKSIQSSPNIMCANI